MKEVAILLSTYQGERYLEEQLASLLNQTHTDLHIIVRDDGSTDRTREILRLWSGRFASWREITDGVNLGPAASFAKLLDTYRLDSSSPYAMFCDQDDVWLSDKVERSLEEMQRLEALHGFSTPLLVHTDLRVVDSDLEEIGPSFWKVAKLNPQTRGDLRHFLVQNCAVGCTFFFNRALTERTGEIPDRGVIMHDWWMALVAAAYGKISALKEPRILYRRHPQTVTSTTQKRQKIKNMIQRREDNFPYIAQAKAFYYTFRKSLSAENLQLVEVTATLLKQSIWRRKWRIIRYRLERQTTLRSLVFLVMI